MRIIGRLFGQNSNADKSSRDVLARARIAELNHKSRSDIRQFAGKLPAEHAKAVITVFDAVESCIQYEDCQMRWWDSKEIDLPRKTIKAIVTTPLFQTYLHQNGINIGHLRDAIGIYYNPDPPACSYGARLKMIREKVLESQNRHSTIDCAADAKMEI